MGLLNILKRSMGFGGADNPEDEAIYGDTAEGISPGGSTAAAPVATAAKQVLEVDEDTCTRIFEHVVEEFNKALPGFLQDSVDNGRQRKHLYDTLAEDLRSYLANLQQAAMDKCQQQWQQSQQELSTQLEQVRRQADDVKRQSDELRQRQLSADRQKRALTERVHDLENQIATLESEREQYQLENRSLINKLKVSGVVQGDVDKLAEEKAADLARQLEQKEAELARQLEQKEAEAADRLKKKDEEIKELRYTITQNLKQHAQREKELRDEIKALRPPTVVSEMQVDFGITVDENAPRISEEDISAIEATFESGEWFTNAPLPDTPPMRPAEPDPDFGYRAPKRKPTPVRSNQPSLFNDL